RIRALEGVEPIQKRIEPLVQRRLLGSEKPLPQRHAHIVLGKVVLVDLSGRVQRRLAEAALDLFIVDRLVVISGDDECRGEGGRRGESHPFRLHADAIEELTFQWRALPELLLEDSLHAGSVDEIPGHVRVSMSTISSARMRKTRRTS